MSIVLKLLQKPQEFSIFFAVLCTAVQVIQSIDPSKHLFYPFLNMPVRLGTLILKNVLNSWNPFSVMALSGFMGHSTILQILATWTPSSSQCYARLKWPTWPYYASSASFYLFMTYYTSVPVLTLIHISLYELLVLVHTCTLYLFFVGRLL